MKYEPTWHTALGGPLNGARIPYMCEDRMSPETHHRVEVVDDNDHVVAVYVWNPAADAFTCRYDDIDKETPHGEE